MRSHTTAGLSGGGWATRGSVRPLPETPPDGPLWAREGHPCPALPLQSYSMVTETVTASSMPLTESFPALTAASFPATPVAGSSAALYHCSAGYCPDDDSDGLSSPHYPDCIPGEEQDCNDADDSIHGRATETCDGFDNDCDGLLDEGCDGQCDAPENLGGDSRITNTGGISQKTSLAWTGSGYGVAWQDDRHGNEEILFATGAPPTSVEGIAALLADLDMLLTDAYMVLFGPPTIK